MPTAPHAPASAASTGSKPDLLLIPGLLCDRDLWRDQLPVLARSHRVHVPLLTQQTSMTSMADAAVALTEGRPFALAGLSMGGHVSFEIARRYPERLHRLAILDSTARADTPERIAQRQQLLEMAKVGRFRGVTDRLLPQLIHADRLQDEALVQRVKAMAETIGRDGFFNQMQAIMARIDSRPSLSRIACPTLVISGREDRLTPPDLAAEIVASVPGAELVIIEDCGHLASMEQPDAVTARLEAFFCA